MYQTGTKYVQFIIKKNIQNIKDIQEKPRFHIGLNSYVK